MYYQNQAPKTRVNKGFPNNYRVRNVQVVGSIPIISTNKNNNLGRLKKAGAFQFW